MVFTKKGTIYDKGIFYNEDGGALAQAAQRSCGYPWIPGSVQGQVGHWGLEQLGIVERVLTHGRGWDEMSFKIPSPPTFHDFMIPRSADGSPDQLATIRLP